MAGMLLKLAPHERVLVNGLVIENGERRAKLRIESPDASILRLRDAIHPDDVRGPVSRAYYDAQLALAGEADVTATTAALGPRLDELVQVFHGTSAVMPLAKARAHLDEGKLYLAMKALGPLLEIEERLLPDAEAAAA